MSLFEKLNNKRYDLQEKKKFAPGSDGKVPVGGNRNQTSTTTTTTTGRVGDLPVDDIPDMSNPKTKKKLDTTEKKLNKLIDKEGKKVDKLTKKISKSTEKSILTKKFKKPIKLVKKLKKYLKNPPSSAIIDTKGNYKKSITALDKNLSKLKQQNKAAKYTALINSTNKNRPESGFHNKRGGANKKFLNYMKRFAKAEKRPLGDVVSRVTKDRASRGLKIGDIDFKNTEKLAQQRTARIDPLTGKATKKGVENYILNRRNKSFVSDAQMKKNQVQAKRIISNPTGKEYRKIEKTINQSSYAGKTTLPATKKELKKTYKAIKSSKTVSATPLPKVYDPKASKEVGTDVFRRIKKTLPRTQKTKVIDTPTRRIQLIKPKPLPKTIDPIKPVTFPSSPLRSSNRIYTPSPTELQKLTSTGFKKTTTGAFTKTGKKSFTKLLTKGLSKMGPRGKVAAGLLALGTTTYGINKLRTVNKTKKQNTMVPPIGFNQNEPEPMKFGISLGPGQQQK